MLARLAARSSSRTTVKIIMRDANIPAEFLSRKSYVCRVPPPYYVLYHLFDIAMAFSEDIMVRLDDTVDLT